MKQTVWRRTCAVSGVPDVRGNAPASARTVGQRKRRVNRLTFASINRLTSQKRRLMVGRCMRSPRPAARPVLRGTIDGEKTIKITDIGCCHRPGATAGAGRFRRLGHEDARVRGGPPAHRFRPRRLVVHAHPRWCRGRADSQDDRADLRRLRHRRPQPDLQDGKGRSYGAHSAGVGLRALSIVDLAAWDVAAKIADKSIAEFLGGKISPMPATAVIGYPPAIMPPDKTGRADRGALCQGLAPLQGADGGDLGGRRGAPARRARRPRPMAGSAPTWSGCSAPSTTRPTTPIASPTRHGLHRGHLPARQCRHAGGTPQARADADLAGRRAGRFLLPGSAASWPARSIASASTSAAWAASPAAARSSTSASPPSVDFGPHMFPHVHSQVLSAWGFYRQADRMGRAVDRRAPLRRQPLPARDRRRRPDEAAARGPGLRHHGQSGMGAEPAA